MRTSRHMQLSIIDTFSEHEIGVQLQQLSNLLDHYPELVDLVHNDLHSTQSRPTGRVGLASETVLRCLILKQLFQVSYQQLSFHLADSRSYRAFARLPMGTFPSRSGLQTCIRNIQPSTLQNLNTRLIQHGLNQGVVNIEHLRIDSTVVKSHITPPSDSQLLNDAIRVLSRLLAKAKDDTGIRFRFTDQRKKAKSLAFRLFNAKKAEKDRLYPELLRMADRVAKQVDRALDKITSAPQWRARLMHFKDLLMQVIDQTTRRVIQQESVPSSEKVVSLFEPHTDVIVKGFRDVQYGHKLNLSSDASGFFTYASLEQGNPSDKELFLPVLHAHQRDYQCLPMRTIADGGYACQQNVIAGRQLGVQAVAFQKQVGLTLTEMGLKQKTLKRLAHFRAGVEGNISELKRRFGCSVARWKGEDGFQAFVWSSILSYNLMRWVRLQQ